MRVYRNVVLPSAVVGLVLMTASCAYRVQLRSPRNSDSVEVGGQASPQFSWRSSYMITRPGDYHEYSLIVARDRGFRNVVFQKKKLESHSYVIDQDEGWLAGDTTYYWKVDGVVRDQDSEERKKLPCEKPRSFTLEKRQTVQVVMTVPEGFTAQIGDTSSELSAGIISVSLENGERQPVTLTSDDRTVQVFGHVWVVAVNDNTKYGKIAINNIEPDKLTLIANGDGVGDFHYELGGERIVEMKLGGKSSSAD